MGPCTMVLVLCIGARVIYVSVLVYKHDRVVNLTYTHHPQSTAGGVGRARVLHRPLARRLPLRPIPAGGHGCVGAYACVCICIQNAVVGLCFTGCMYMCCMQKHGSDFVRYMHIKTHRQVPPHHLPRGEPPPGNKKVEDYIYVYIYV